jgi:hypothetical protein
MVIYINAWRAAKREHQNQQPASVLVTPGKMNQQGVPGAYPAPGIVYVQANAQPGLQQTAPGGQPVQYVQQGAYQLQPGQQQYTVQPTMFQMPPQNEAAYPAQPAQYGMPRPDSMSPGQMVQPPLYQQVPQAQAVQPVQMMQPGQQYQVPQRYQQPQQYHQVQRTQPTPPQPGSHEFPV